MRGPVMTVRGGSVGGRHCLQCGAALTGSRFCINCGAMADGTPGSTQDGDTLTDPQVHYPQRTKRALWFGVALLGIVVAGGALWLLRQAPADVEADPGQSASQDPAAPESTTSTSSSPSASPEAPSTPTTEPSGLPTRGPLTALIPASVTATCDGEPGFDSGGNLVTLDVLSLVDGRSDTAWRCTYRRDTDTLEWDPAKNRAVGESITFTFSSPVEVVGARFIPGYTKVDPFDETNRYAQNGRPVLVEWRFGDDAVVSQEVRPKSPSSRPECKDAATACALGTEWWSGEALNPNPNAPIDSVTLTILAIEPGNDAKLTNSAAISEVEIVGYSQ